MKISAYQYALNLLALQDYSEFKLRQKLRLKQFSSEDIDNALEKVKEKNYLRESEYKRRLARKYLEKGYSDALIKRRASEEGLTVEASELNDWRTEGGTERTTVIQKLIAKKLRNQAIPEDREARRKLRDKISRFLLSKGHGFDEIKRAVDAALKADTEATL